jgi:hypothetical protein
MLRPVSRWPTAVLEMRSRVSQTEMEIRRLRKHAASTANHPNHSVATGASRAGRPELKPN